MVGEIFEAQFFFVEKNQNFHLVFLMYQEVTLIMNIELILFFRLL